MIWKTKNGKITAFPSGLPEIPKEKFAFASARDFVHDKKLATKPRSYMRDAMSRFCKNKGAIVGAVVILVLVLFAIIVPFLRNIR